MARVMLLALMISAMTGVMEVQAQITRAQASEWYQAELKKLSVSADCDVLARLLTLLAANQVFHEKYPEFPDRQVTLDKVAHTLATSCNGEKPAYLEQSCGTVPVSSRGTGFISGGGGSTKMIPVTALALIFMTNDERRAFIKLLPASQRQEFDQFLKSDPESIKKLIEFAAQDVAKEKVTSTPKNLKDFEFGTGPPHE